MAKRPYGGYGFYVIKACLMAVTITVKVIPQAKKSLVKKEEGLLKVYIRAPAVEGKANGALIELLAGYFDVRKSQIQIIKGLKSRIKTISIG